jgi:hypothetical protein
MITPKCLCFAWLGAAGSQFVTTSSALDFRTTHCRLIIDGVRKCSGRLTSSPPALITLLEDGPESKRTEVGAAKVSSVRVLESLPLPA